MKDIVANPSSARLALSTLAEENTKGKARASVLEETVDHLNRRIETLQDQIHQLDKDNATLSIELRNAEGRKTERIFLTILGGAILAIGVDLLSDEKKGTVGAVLAAVGLLVQCVPIFAPFGKRLTK